MPVTFTVGPLPFNTTIVVMGAITAILAMLFAGAAVASASGRVPGRMQNILEMLVQGIEGLIHQSLGERRGSSFVGIGVSLFLYILIANTLGLLPIPNFFVPNAPEQFFTSPTAHLNTTIALAVMIFFIVQYYGIKYNGLWGYFSHFFAPPLPLMPILEELTKPITMAFRLFGNILAGEALLGFIVKLGITGTLLGGFLAGLVWLGFSAFVAVVQAFIFFMLLIAYVSVWSSHADEHHAKSHKDHKVPQKVVRS